MCAPDGGEAPGERGTIPGSHLPQADAGAQGPPAAGHPPRHTHRTGGIVPRKQWDFPDPAECGDDAWNRTEEKAPHPPR